MSVPTSADDLLTAPAHRIAAWVRAGECSAAQVLQRFLTHIDQADTRVGAWRRLDVAGAERRAEAIDTARARGDELGPLAGVPVGLKDIFVTEGLETDCGSRMLAGWVPGYAGTHAQRLEAAGAIVVGKLAMDEFAMGSSNENTPFGAVKNPWDPVFVPGGSSGGSAAAVAARMCPIALGSDTGGSIRQPAALCGVAGLKPSYGRVSRHGMIAFASSLDQAGPLAHDVRDLALAFDAMAGDDPRDASCVALDLPDLGAAMAKGASGAKGLRIGLHRAALEHEGLDPAVRTNFEGALQRLVDAGAQLVDVELPHFDLAIPCYYVICTAEAASNLARYDGLRFGPGHDAETLHARVAQARAQGFGDEVKRRIMLGTFVLRADSFEAYYGRAMRVRRLIANDYAQAFERCDVLASPVSPVAGFRRGARVDDPLAMYLSDVFTIGVNLAGLPAMSVPSGFVACEGSRMPVGLQLIAPAFEEARLFRAAAAYQALHPEGTGVPAWVAGESQPSEGGAP